MATKNIVNLKDSILKSRLRKALLDVKVVKIARKDIRLTFKNIGLSKLESEILTGKIIGLFTKNNTLKQTETEVKSLLKRTKVGKKPFFDALNDSLLGREEIIFGQVSPFLKRINGKALDFGAGSGEIAQMLHDRNKLDIEAVDISDFRSKRIKIPFLIFKGKRVPVSNNYYEVALVANVIHHDANNDQVLKELTRIVDKKLVIIETVPVNNTKEQWERTFVTDVLWNRFFHYANVPVPGTYESPAGWIKRFEKHGWKLTKSKKLGYDQPTAVGVFHYLLIFEKK